MNNIYTQKTKTFKMIENKIEKSYFNTKTNVIPFDHVWEIQNIETINKECDDTMFKEQKINENVFDTKVPYLKTKFSPRGLKASINNIKFKLYCYPFGTNKENDEYMALLLKLDLCSISQVSIQYKLSILDKNENKCNVKGKFFYYLKKY